MDMTKTGTMEDKLFLEVIKKRKTRMKSKNWIIIVQQLS